MNSDSITDYCSSVETLELVKAAIEHASYSVIITTANLDRPGPEIVYVTPAFLLLSGYKLEDVIGKSPRLFQGPNTERSVLARMRERLTEGKPFRCELINYRKDRSEYLVELTIDPVRDANGKITHFVAVQHDITERKQAEESLVHAERLAAIGAAMAGLSHESRNALQRAQASLELISQEVVPSSELSQLVDDVRRAHDDLRQLYEEVREFAAPVRLKPKECHLDEILHDTWVTLALRREGRKVHLLEHAGDLDLRCEVDPFAIRSVLRNILENALAACRDPVEIHVTFAATDLHGKPAVQISLRDNGPGLNAEQRQRIFDQFYTTKAHGTGLGMAIAKRVVEGHRGRIAVGDVNQPGAEILVTLPRRVE